MYKAELKSTKRMLRKYLGCRDVEERNTILEQQRRQQIYCCDMQIEIGQAMDR